LSVSITTGISNRTGTACRAPTKNLSLRGGPSETKGDEAISAARKAERLDKNTPVVFLEHLNGELLLSD
jgi:hypothetical protein